MQVYAKSWVFEATAEDEYRQPGDSSSASICSSPTKPPPKCLSTPQNHATINSNHKQKYAEPSTGRASKLSDATSERYNTQMSSFSRCATPSPIPNSGQITPTNLNFTDYLETVHVMNHTNTFRKHNKTLLTIDYMPPNELIKVNDTITSSTSIPKSSITATTTTTTSSGAAAAAAAAASTKYPTKIILQNSNGPSSISSSQQDDSQYASMLAELEQSLIDKKSHAANDPRSPDDTSLTASTDKFGSSKSSSKDLEFSKELEAALQLIQDLETPSEGPNDGTHPTSAKIQRSESEKTLSAAISLPSPEQMPYKLKSPDGQTPQTGKQYYRRKNVIHIEPSSQSTSGYSSPNSFSSNAQLSHSSCNGGNGITAIAITSTPTPTPTSPTSTPIYHSDQANIVRIYIDSNEHGEHGKHEINANKFISSTYNSNLLTKGHILNASNLIDTIDATKSTTPTDSINKSFLLFKKRSKLMPHSDFQNRIFKSECLAYLTDDELVARHKCNRDVIRVR